MIQSKAFSSNLGLPFEESRLLKKLLKTMLSVLNWNFYKSTKDEDFLHLI